MNSKRQKQTIPKEINIPEWYLELEPMLLEQMDALTKMENKLKLLRQVILDKMEDDDLDVIKSSFVKIARIKPATYETILKEKLKKEAPEIYARYVKISMKQSTLQIRLLKNKAL